MVFLFENFNNELILVEKRSEKIKYFSNSNSLPIKNNNNKNLDNNEQLDTIDFNAHQNLHSESTSDFSEENIDENHPFSACSSSSTSATTSAYFSCSDSTHLFANTSKLIDEDDSNDLDQFDSCSIIEEFLEEPESCSLNSFQTELIKSVCAQIDAKYCSTVGNIVSDCGDLKLNGTFWAYLLNKLSLIEILNNLNASKDILDDFRINLSRLIVTLTRLENELVNYIVDNSLFNTRIKWQFSKFSGDFLLNLAFLIFEQVARRVDANNSRVITMFELDLDRVFDCSFEQHLDQFLNNWVLLYLPSKINNKIQTCFDGNGIFLI